MIWFTESNARESGGLCKFIAMVSIHLYMAERMCNNLFYCVDPDHRNEIICISWWIAIITLEI